ncbi:MAG: hypothetical protein JRC86_03400 [Deltaproteobacteria bacterium]|nr:hypothetical protein [Deltaproteobacteria bacterium]
MRKLLYLSVLVAVAFLFWGCDWFSSDDDKGSKFKDYSTGVVETLEAVPADGTKTLQAGTADTHEVETDGKWIVWKGRSINLGYFDGADVTDLDTGLEASVTPWAFSYCDDSPIGFDGTTIVAVANDVASADTPEFYYYVPEDGTGGEIDLPFDGAKDLQDDYFAYVSGDLAVVADEDAGKVYRAFLSDATPAFTEITALSAEPVGGAGVYVAVINTTDGRLDIYDMSAGTITATPLTGDGTVAAPSDFRSANGIFTWIEAGNAYYYEPGVSTDSVEIDVSAVTQYDPVAGPDYFLWDEGGSTQYLARADVGTGTPDAVSFPGDISNLEAGDGFFAYVTDDTDGDSQIFVYDLSDLTATEGVQVTENGEGADEDQELVVDGTKIYDVFEYNDVCNPSRVLVMYDVATDELLELTGDRDFQQTPAYVAADGKAIFLHRDHSFRLFVKKAASTARPTVVTPPYMMVNGKFDVTNGVVAFHALDRSRYIDNPGLAEDFSGDDLIEVYYIDLDGARKIKQITNNGIRDKRAMTDGAFVTWFDENDYAWAYKIATGESQMIGPSGYKVSVDDGIAVWQDDDDLYYCDLNTWDAIEAVQVEGEFGVDDCPDIAGGLITWEYDNHPYYYDLNADPAEVVNIYEVEPSADYTASSVYHTRTDGRFITWEERRTVWDHDGDDGDVTGTISAYVIVAYDTVNEELLTIPAADWTVITATCRPRISDGVVVFAAEEYGVENPDYDKEIFYCDVTAETLELVRLTADPADAGLWDSMPEVTDGLIVWRSGGSSSWGWRGRSVAAARIY